MASKRDNGFVFPLCGCTGTGGGPLTCGKRIEGLEDDESTLAEPIPAMSASRRGPISAANYDPDPSDPIDVELSWHLTSIDHKALAKMLLQRLEPGEYAIEGRHVSIHWGTFGPGPCSQAELLVSEEKEDGDWDALETPLPIYLRQALDVSASLGGHGAPAVARVPPNERLSFFNLPSGLPVDAENERLVCMKRACEEARLREEAVEVYELHKLVNSESIPPLVPLSNGHRINSTSLTSESRLPSLPPSTGSVSSPGKTIQKSRFPAAYGAYMSSGTGRPMPSAPAPPPVISASRVGSRAENMGRIPAGAAGLRKV